jgi:hypothetical protein
VRMRRDEMITFVNLAALIKRTWRSVYGDSFQVC